MIDKVNIIQFCFDYLILNHFFVYYEDLRKFLKNNLFNFFKNAMKKFRLVYNPQPKAKKLILSNININSLSEPIELTLQPQLVDTEEPRMANRRKSEVFEEDDDNLSTNFILMDSENKSFVGKKVEMKKNYFAFLTKGNLINVTPIDDFYRFSLLNTSKANDFLVKDYKEEKETSEEKEEIDYEYKFDDDNSEDEMQIQRVKKLSKTGKKLNTLVESFAKQDEINVERELRNILFNSKGMILKELVSNLKKKIKEIGNEEKEIIRNFIKEECEVEETIDGKLLRLKK